MFAIEKYKNNAIVPGEGVIPPSGKVIGKEEIQNMVDASLDAWLTTGRFNERFEKRLDEFLGVKYCLSVNSGSSANLVAFSRLTSPKLGDRAIKRGDIIGVAAGFPSYGKSGLYSLRRPVFVDVEIETHNIMQILLKLRSLPKPRQSCWLILWAIHLCQKDQRDLR